MELYLATSMNFRIVRAATYLYMMSKLFLFRFLSMIQLVVVFCFFLTDFAMATVIKGWRYIMQDPVVDSIRAAVDRLTHSTNFLNYMAKHALIMQEELPTPVEEQPDDDRYHFMSLFLNLANTFLYMVNTYIIVPTADDYSMSLGAAATVCGIVIGAMAVAQVFSSVYFSAWSNRSYFRPLVFSSIVLLLGNTLYALAYDFNSIALLLIGRLCCG